jgi:hypothetical protein
MSQCGARQNEARTGPCGQDCTSHSSANLIATRCMDGESKNAETYLPLPPPTRRRVCTGVYVIHFILCGLPELGRAFLIIEQRLFALGAMRCRMRLVLYVVLTTFFRPSRARSESKHQSGSGFSHGMFRRFPERPVPLSQASPILLCTASRNLARPFACMLFQRVHDVDDFRRCVAETTLEHVNDGRLLAVPHD